MSIILAGLAGLVIYVALSCVPFVLIPSERNDFVSYSLARRSRPADRPRHFEIGALFLAMIVIALLWRSIN